MNRDLVDVYISRFVERIICRINPNIKCHPTTGAYIYFLFKPYIERLRKIDNMKDVVKWLFENIPKPLATDVHSWMKKSFEEILSAFDSGNIILHDDIVKNINDDDALITILTTNIIEYLIYPIIVKGITEVEIYYDKTILPWDILRVISSDKYLVKMLNITDKLRLPVTITVRSRELTQLWTAEYTCGLLLFSSISCNNFSVSLFNTPFSPEYMINNTNRFVTPDRLQSGNYIVQIRIQSEDNRYYFDEIDFMYGFTMGAFLAGVDHNIFWKNLVRNEDGKIIKF